MRGDGAVALLAFAMLLGSGVTRDRGLGLGGCAMAAERQWRIVRVRMIAVMAEQGRLIRGLDELVWVRYCYWKFVSDLVTGFSIKRGRAFGRGKFVASA